MEFRKIVRNLRTLLVFCNLLDVIPSELGANEICVQEGCTYTLFTYLNVTYLNYSSLNETHTLIDLTTN